MKTPAEVHKWAAKYPVEYDALNYDPFIGNARLGNPDALRRVTEWKNPGRGNPPTAMRLSANKEIAFQRFLTGLGKYLKNGGEKLLRHDFLVRSPVYAIFWHHVLYETPIFDVHTHRAMIFFTTGELRAGRATAIRPKGHWELYDCYCEWLWKTLEGLQLQDSSITERQLDRALIQWGMAHR